jgi:hypothetical protein
MVTRQAPASAILLHGHPVAGGKMPPEHLAAPATFKANDIIVIDGSPDRDGGYPLFVEFDCGFTESCEGLMYGRD